MSIRIAGVIPESVVDGPGLRLVIFFQGCYHNCFNCHNPDTHPLDGGKEVREEQIIRLIDETPLISGVTFSGGEPMLQADKLVNIARYIKEQKCYNLVIFTGYVYEELLRIAETNSAVRSLLQLTDWLIDGPYVDSERDISLAFRGSKNQRIIDVPSSLAAERTIVVECANA